MTMSNYQIGAGTVSNFNSPHVSQTNAGQPGSINVAGRRLKQQNYSHNNFGSLMTSPGKFGNNHQQPQYSPIHESMAQKRTGGPQNQPLRGSLSKNKSGGWPPNSNLSQQPSAMAA